ncbi:DHA2 family efflux MFS transporter permease subunit [Streptomyces beijiangensis]|uniref:DHA2 family efflux MFS transporter permease subunit n=1 Tax=Streptomyces beijiangensis TaxID=163361 RepID=A0A939JJ70_9ACTN|nr:DHA2 family efflux MFS transporter permease subunit [Streptomyces beijiangensis]MBO0516273.1 DHA2 family efflux MFS transporter permease subunit [Streptomyces beijiangensis]
MSTTSAAARQAPAPAATPNRHGPLAVAAVVILGSFMTVLDMTIVNVALGHLSTTFHAPLSTIQWTATGYTLALATVIPVTAWAMSRFGTKRLYLTAITLFVLGSALTGLAWSSGSLIAFRVLQGLGGGMIMPIGMTIVLRAADPARKGRMMGLLGIPVLVGPMAGPVLGGWFVDSFSWRWIFFINIPVGIAALVLGTRILHADRPSGTPRRLDLPALLMLSPGLAALIYGLSVGGEHADFTTPGVLVPSVAGAALLAAAIVRTLRSDRPLINLALLRSPSFARAVTTLVPFTAAYFGSMILIPLYWQNVRGLTATETGLLAIPQALVTGTTMQIASRLTDRIAPRRIATPGVLIAVTGFLLATLQSGAHAPIWRLSGSLTLMGVGIGMTMMPTMTSATRSLTGEDIGSATTALTIIQQVSASLGTALMAVLLTTTGSFTAAFGWAVALMALALPSALRLSAKKP